MIGPESDAIELVDTIFEKLADELETARGRPVDLISTRALRPRHMDAIRPETLLV